MNITYIDSQSITVQGKATEVRKRYGKDWHIKPLGNGNGNWLLTKPSDVLVNGVSYRSFVLTYYNKSRLTSNLVDTFRKDVNNGKIQL